MFIKQIRSILELAVPAWQGAITQADKTAIERVQKAALNIILGSEYTSYRNALKFLNLETLDQRRDKLCLKFAKKAEYNPKFENWFVPSTKPCNTRNKPTKYKEVVANRARYKKAPLATSQTCK